MDILYELLVPGGRIVAAGRMPWFYVMPRIIKYEGAHYALLSAAWGPGPGNDGEPIQYMFSREIYEPDLSLITKVV